MNRGRNWRETNRNVVSPPSELPPNSWGDYAARCRVDPFVLNTNRVRLEWHFAKLDDCSGHQAFATTSRHC